MSQVLFYPKSNTTSQNFQDWSCAICLTDDPSTSGGTVAHEGGEAHPIHLDCLKTSLVFNTACPTCRYPIDPFSTSLNNTWAFITQNPSAFFNYLNQSASSFLGGNVVVECGAATAPFVLGCVINDPLTIALGGLLTRFVTNFWEKPLKSEADTANDFLNAAEKITRLSSDKEERLHQNYLDSVVFTNEGGRLEYLNESIGKLPTELQDSTRAIFQKAIAEDPEPLRETWQKAKKEAEKDLSATEKLRRLAIKHNFRYWTVYLLNRAALSILILKTMSLGQKKAK